MIFHDDPNDIEYSTAMRLKTGDVTPEQFQRYEGYAAEIFSAIGLELNTPAAKDTSKRFIKALFDATEGNGHQIADTLETMLLLCGVAVYLEANHLCVEVQGVRGPAPRTRTTVWRSHYAEDLSLRSEFLVACGLQRNEK